MQDENSMWCPWCEKPSGILSEVRLLGEFNPLTCKNCGNKVSIEHDYSGEDYDLSIWLIKDKENGKA